MTFIFGFQIDWEQALGVLALFFLKKNVFYLANSIFFRTFAL